MFDIEPTRIKESQKLRPANELIYANLGLGKAALSVFDLVTSSFDTSKLWAECASPDGSRLADDLSVENVIFTYKNINDRVVRLVVNDIYKYANVGKDYKLLDKVIEELSGCSFSLRERFIDKKGNDVEKISVKPFQSVNRKMIVFDYELEQWVDIFLDSVCEKETDMKYKKRKEELKSSPKNSIHIVEFILEEKFIPYIVGGRKYTELNLMDLVKLNTAYSNFWFKQIKYKLSTDRTKDEWKTIRLGSPDKIRERLGITDLNTCKLSSSIIEKRKNDELNRLEKVVVDEHVFYLYEDDVVKKYNRILLDKKKYDTNAKLIELVLRKPIEKITRLGMDIEVELHIEKERKKIKNIYIYCRYKSDKVNVYERLLNEHEEELQKKYSLEAAINYLRDNDFIYLFLNEYLTDINNSIDERMSLMDKNFSDECNL